MASHWLFRGIVRLLGALGLAGGILWQVVQTTEQGTCRAVVHAMHVGDVVLVDDMERRVENLEDLPFVFDLGPGQHRAQLLREGVMMDNQTFELGTVREIVLVLWGPNNDPTIAEPAHVPASVVLGDRLGREVEPERAAAASPVELGAVKEDSWSLRPAVSASESRLDRKNWPAAECRRRGCTN